MSPIIKHGSDIPVLLSRERPLLRARVKQRQLALLQVEPHQRLHNRVHRLDEADGFALGQVAALDWGYSFLRKTNSRWASLIWSVSEIIAGLLVPFQQRSFGMWYTLGYANTFICAPAHGGRAGYA